MSSVRKMWAAGAAVVAIAAAGTAVIAGTGKTVVNPKADLKWVDGAVAGVSSATVDGDMNKGASHFFLKYKAGLVTPVHHHTADHYVSLMSGTLVLTADGKDSRLGPGSYFALLGMAPHAARCEGTEDCVMFVDARNAWDVVPEKQAAAK